MQIVVLIKEQAISDSANIAINCLKIKALIKETACLPVYCFLYNNFDE